MSRTRRATDPIYNYHEGWKANADKKRWWKPNKKFKALQKQIRKAKERQAFRERKDVPIFKKTDVWNWT